MSNKNLKTAAYSPMNKLTLSTYSDKYVVALVEADGVKTVWTTAWDLMSREDIETDEYEINYVVDNDVLATFVAMDLGINTVCVLSCDVYSEKYDFILRKFGIPFVGNGHSVTTDPNESLTDRIKSML